MVEIGVGTVVTSHGWLYEHRNKDGGLDKKLLVNSLMDRCDTENRRLVEHALEVAKRCNTIYERNSNIYIVPRN